MLAILTRPQMSRSQPENFPETFDAPEIPLNIYNYLSMSQDKLHLFNDTMYNATIKIWRSVTS